jgi:hypothetical protein
LAVAMRIYGINKYDDNDDDDESLLSSTNLSNMDLGIFTMG